MRCAQPASCGDERAQDLAPRASLPSEPAGECAAIDVLHCQKYLALLCADFLNGDDIRMGEGRREVLGLDVVTSEDALHLFAASSLAGLSGVELVISTVPKSMQGSVRAQHARVVEQLAPRFPKAAKMLADAVEDLLAFTSFPKEHWRQIWSVLCELHDDWVVVRRYMTFDIQQREDTPMLEDAPKRAA